MRTWMEDYFMKVLDWAMDIPQVVQTTQVGVVRNALSHIAGAETEQEFFRGLSNGFGAIMVKDNREQLLEYISRWRQAPQI